MKLSTGVFILTILLLSTLCAFGETKNSFTEKDFCGKFILTDPTCSYVQYHGEIILSGDGKGKSKEYTNNKQFEPLYKDLLDKDGYLSLKWSFDESRKELIIDWTMNGKYPKLAYFKSKIKGNINNFTINGFDWQGAQSHLNFTRIEGDFTKAVLVNKQTEENFIGLYDLMNPEPKSHNYHGEVILFKDGTGKVREYMDNKPVEPAHPEALDKNGYLPVKWSFNKDTMEFIFDWSCGGKFKDLSCFKGKVIDANNFTLDGTWVNGYTGYLQFKKVD